MKKQRDGRVDEEWMTTYTDMVSLLLCFFVLIAAVSKPDFSKFEKIRSGMNESLGKQNANRPLEMMMFELKDDIQGINENDISLGNDSRGIVLEFSGDVTFDFGSAEIKNDMLPTLKRIAATLRSERYQNFIFSIEGHTSDEKFSSSKYPSNWELSSARAAAVARFLESRGIERIRLRAMGLYDISPKYPNFNPFGEAIPENRKKNRRVTIHIEPFYEFVDN